MTILSAERRNYDSAKAAEHLAAVLPAGRALLLDVSELGPDDVVSRIADWSAAELD